MIPTCHAAVCCRGWCNEIAWIPRTKSTSSDATSWYCTRTVSRGSKRYGRRPKRPNSTAEYSPLPVGPTTKARMIWRPCWRRHCSPVRVIGQGSRGDWRGASGGRSGAPGPAGRIEPEACAAVRVCVVAVPAASCRMDRNALPTSMVRGCVRLIASTGGPCAGASLGRRHVTRTHGRTATCVMHRVTLLLYSLRG
jgi:hypothetical protein